MPRGQELIIILIVIAVLFGAKRLPDSARSLGRSLRIFKSEMKEMIHIRKLVVYGQSIETQIHIEEN